MEASTRHQNRTVSSQDMGARLPQEYGALTGGSIPFHWADLLYTLLNGGGKKKKKTAHEERTRMFLETAADSHWAVVGLKVSEASHSKTEQLVA